MSATAPRYSLTALAPVLLVDAVEPSIAFWTTQLGFVAENQVPGPDGKLIFASVKKNGVEIMYQTRASVLADSPAAAAELDGRAATLFITVPSVTDLNTIERATHGASVFKPRHDTFYGTTEFYIREPGGHVVGFAAPKKSPAPPARDTSMAPPRLLYVYREFWKPGTQAALNRIEADAARMCIERGCPHPYLGIESLTGSKEVWYLNGFSSTEEQNRVAEEYTRKGLFALMTRFADQRAPFQAEPGKEGAAAYRADLSRGAPWSIGQGRFLVIAVTTGDTGRDGTVFETQDGMRFIVTPTWTRAEANAKLAAAGPGARIFAVRPRFSMPAPEWVAADPSFWRTAATGR